MTTVKDKSKESKILTCLYCKRTSKDAPKAFEGLKGKDGLCNCIDCRELMIPDQQHVLFSPEVLAAVHNGTYRCDVKALDKLATSLEQKNLIEQAAEKRYPHTEDNTYHNCCQNSKRGDFSDGALWMAGHCKLLWPRMYNALIEVVEIYEPVDQKDQELFQEIKMILEAAQEITISKKKFDKPTYPIK